MIEGRGGARHALTALLATTILSGCVVKSSNDAPATTTPPTVATGTARAANPGTGYLSGSRNGAALVLDSPTAGATLTQFADRSVKLTAPNIPINGSTDTVTFTGGYFYTLFGAFPGATLQIDGISTIGRSATLFDAGPAVQTQYSDFGFWTAAPTTSSAVSEMGVFAVAAGTSTAAIQLSKTATAIYTGNAVGYVSNAQGSGYFSGLVSMTANFASSTISGGIGSIRVGGASQALPLGTMNDIALAANISGTGFTGTASASATGGSYLNINGATGTLGGNFYGPTGQEAVGVFQLAGGTNNTQLLGSFGSLVSSSSADASAAVPQLGLVADGTPFTLTRSVGFESATFAVPTTGGTTTTVPSYTYDVASSNASLVFYANGNLVLTAPNIPANATVQTLGGSTDTVTFVQNGFSPVGNVQAGVVPSGTLAETSTSVLNHTPVTLYRAGGSAGLVYSDFGEWITAPATIPSSAGVYGVGVPTPSTQMPKTGTSTYTGETVGVVSGKNTVTGLTISSMFSGTASLTANFATNAINGNLNNLVAQFGTNVNNTLGPVQLAGTISGTGFSGTATVATAPQPFFDMSGASGQFGGKFFGPNAAEIAGTFHLSGGSGGGSVNMIGSFGGHH